MSRSISTGELLFRWTRPLTMIQVNKAYGELIPMEPMNRPELSSRLCRQVFRYQFRADAEIAWHSKTAWGQVTDISRKGMFIAVSHPPPLGASLTVRLALNVPLRLDYVVRRVTEKGVGVTLSIGEKGRRRFECLLLALSAGEDDAGKPSNEIRKLNNHRTMVATTGR